MRIWRELLLGFLLGAVAVLGYREYVRLHPSLKAAMDDSVTTGQPIEVLPAGFQFDGGAESNTDINQSRRNAITQAIQKVAPAVLGINVTQVREVRERNPFWNDPMFRGMFPNRIYRDEVENLGSGFIINSDGHIVTNEHVVHNATEIVVTTAGGEKYRAQIIGADYYSDIALLKIDAQNLPAIEYGNSDSVIIGEWAIALGNPFGLFANNDQPSVTVGVISAVNRDFSRTAEGRIYKDMIQTDASINRGNSGGPLVNSLGQVIGMATMIFTENGGSLGVGFATPINRIKEITEELRTAGGVNRNYWTGLAIQNLDKLTALSLKQPNTDGVIVTDIEPNSPGEQAGFHAGDVILAINHQLVKNYNAVRAYLENEDLRVGDRLVFTIVRDGKQLNLDLKLAQMPQ